MLVETRCPVTRAPLSKVLVVIVDYGGMAVDSKRLAVNKRRLVSTAYPKRMVDCQCWYKSIALLQQVAVIALRKNKSLARYVWRGFCAMS